MGNVWSGLTALGTGTRGGSCEVAGALTQEQGSHPQPCAPSRQYEAERPYTASDRSERDCLRHSQRRPPAARQPAPPDSPRPSLSLNPMSWPQPYIRSRILTDVETQSLTVERGGAGGGLSTVQAGSPTLTRRCQLRSGMRIQHSSCATVQHRPRLQSS